MSKQRMSDLEHYISTALKLAADATETAHQTWSQDLLVDYKADGSALTQADLNIEIRWREAIRKNYPSHGILGEEFGTETGDSAFTWVLDPIDGTRAFGAGLLNYASLISLCRDGTPILGLIALPMPGLLFWAAEGHGTHFEGRRVHTSGRQELDHSVIHLANPESFGSESLSLYDQLKTKGKQRVYDAGSPAYGALSRGLIDLSLNGDDLDAFDICALCPIVQEAGGVISDLNGKPLSILSKGAIVASASPALHQHVLSL
ncbi:Inositol-1-monophosphatase [Cognatishimia activa]|uniref:Inositol-1-monophosphatase n=2 Tax=Cognatishimia activa TaxID=1715691 RepID=A0A0P1IZA7_9RHOB|nr:Inositol-1-monophosphatase [Cognatishimia activa]CUK27066.1 Inositol-1-monophosphatase [Cognatishimia activa]